MKRRSLMLVAGETSGDLLGAELVPHLRQQLLDSTPDGGEALQPLHTSLAPRFFGAGGNNLARAGVDVRVDLTRHAVVGLWEVIKKYQDFRRLYAQLIRMAQREEPAAIICIDFSGFNIRFAEAIRRRVIAAKGTFWNWNPLLVQYVSPQVWASRPGRAERLGRSCDLLLSIFPFEAAWYRQRVPSLRVEFVGHPLLDRYPHISQSDGGGVRIEPGKPMRIVLLPGSREGEIRRHLPVMLQALEQLRSGLPNCSAALVLPTQLLLELARQQPLPADLEVRVGELDQALATAHLAIASTGTVTLECALFKVPTVAIYKTSWSTYQIGKRLILVRFLAMPNLLADAEIFPEFIQDAATPKAIAAAAADLLLHPERHAQVRARLGALIRTLGHPGASARAARAIVAAMNERGEPWRAALAG